MKKLIIFGFIALLLIGTTIAVTLGNKQTAIDYWGSHKTTRDTNIGKALGTITYTSDKDCQIVYDSGSIICGVCFEVDISGQIEEECINVPEGLTRDETNVIVKEYAQIIIEEFFPKEDIKYTEDNIEGVSISIP